MLGNKGNQSAAIHLKIQWKRQSHMSPHVSLEVQPIHCSIPANVRPCLKTQRWMAPEEWHLRVFTAFQMHRHTIHKCMHSWAHTCTHIYKYMHRHVHTLRDSFMCLLIDQRNYLLLEVVVVLAVYFTQHRVVLTFT